MKRWSRRYQGRLVADHMSRVITRLSGPTPSSKLERLAMRVLAVGDRGCFGAVLVSFQRTAGYEVGGK